MDFNFEKETKKEKKTSKKKSDVPVIELPKEHEEGLEKFKKCKELEAQFKALKADEDIEALRVFGLDNIIERTQEGKPSSSLRLEAENGDTVNVVTTQRWKNLKDDESVDFFKNLLGELEFDKRATKKTELKGDLDTIQKAFQAYIKEKGLDEKTAATIFEFIVSNFAQSTAYSFEKEAFTYPELVESGGGDTEKAKKIIETIAYTKPYLKK